LAHFDTKCLSVYPSVTINIIICLLLKTGKNSLLCVLGAWRLFEH